VVKIGQPWLCCSANPGAVITLHEQQSRAQTAIIVAVKLSDVSEHEFESSLAELERLVTTLGYRVVQRLTQVRSQLSSAAVLGEGKLKELADLTGGTGDTSPVIPRKRAKAHEQEDLAGDERDDAADDDREPKIDLVVVDHEISPSQLRNLERATGTTALDRTGVIIEIFHRHAKSREARMQVEIARLSYEAPRLRESPKGKERQQGRGAGEAALELDRRRIRDRIAELREQLEIVQREQAVRRAHRREARRVALVGYTNAGKSSLMRALTGSDVYVENKLFATLDTTVRALQPEARPRILVSDTVGFIKKLPHDLVASFKSTLDEALEASLLLHVVDAADPNWESQLQVTRDVLTEIGASEVPSRLVMNKIDCLPAGAVEDLRQAAPDAWFISAKNPEDVARVRGDIVGFFEASYIEAEIVVPYDRQRFVSELHDAGRVLEERYEEDGVHVRVRSDPSAIESVRARLRQV
jgi:GTP-binding protein HflX